MTFIAPTRSARPFDVAIRSAGWLRRGSKTTGRVHAVDEDLARRVMGNDNTMPAALLPGSSLEHLARIAFG